MADLAANVHGDGLPLREIAASYLAGVEFTDLGDAYGVPAGTINYWLAMAGVPLRPAGHRLTLTRDVLDDLIRRRKAGESFEELAIAAGIGQAKLRALLIQRGAPARILVEDRLPVAQILRRYRAGEPASALATEYEVNERFVYRLLAKHGVPRRRNTRQADS